VSRRRLQSAVLSTFIYFLKRKFYARARVKEKETVNSLKYYISGGGLWFG